MTMSPLQLGQEGWNLAADGGTWVDCLCMAKTPEVSSFRAAGPRASWLGVMVQRQRNSGGRMGRHRRGDVVWRCQMPRVGRMTGRTPELLQ